MAERDGALVGSVMLFPPAVDAYGGAARRVAGAAELGLHGSVSLRAATRLYERMGFVRAPEYDFEPE